VSANDWYSSVHLNLLSQLFNSNDFYTKTIFTNLTLLPMGLIKDLCSNIFLIVSHIRFLPDIDNLSSLRFFILFLLDAGFQALIQYNSRQEAVEAFGSLHGRNIYDGCCQLDIQYSKYEHPIKFEIRLPHFL
jgi:hypothetical protein